MTRKEMILQMIGKLPDDVSYDRVIYHLDVMKAVEVGMEQIERGEGIPHERVFAELLAEDEKSKANLVPRRKTRSQGHTNSHRKGSPADGNRIHPKTKKVRRKPAKVS